MAVKFESEHITKERQKNSVSSFLNQEVSLFSSSFSDKKKEAFYAELSILLRSGFNLKKALELLIETQKSESHKFLMTEITRRITDGQPLHEILSSKKQFSTYESQAIKIGEKTGKLYQITDDLHKFYRQKNEQRRQVFGALSYPLIILITATIVVSFMMVFVVPLFENLFRQNGAELPWMTRVVINASNFISEYSLAFILFFLALPFLLKYLRGQKWYKRPIDYIKLKLPIIGPYLRKVHITQFTQAMALLTNAKVPMVKGITMVSNMISFFPLKDSLNTIEKDIIAGKNMSSSFSKFKFYEKKMVALLKVAEETNETEFIFQKLYDQYSGELQYRSQIFTSMLNPIFIFIIAVVVTFILVALYLPMFKLGSVLG